MKKPLPFTYAQIEQIVRDHPTPVYVYTEREMVENSKALINAFSWNRGFKEYYAVKAAPNPYLMKILRAHGLGMDASSLAELELSNVIGMKGEEIMFTSNNTPAKEYRRAIELGAIINLDDRTHVDYLHKSVGMPELISFRLNPGDALGGSGIIGLPSEAKFGLTREQLFEAYQAARSCGARRFGLHTMPISNNLDQSYFPKTVRTLLEIALELKKELEISLDFINMGGGLGIPYRPDDKPIDVVALSRSIEGVFQETLVNSGIEQPKLFMECGRYITGPYGFLITRAIHTKDTYRRYIGVDATMANLMRPGMYDAYHHITVLGKEEAPTSEVYDIVGSLCENNDKFAKQRNLPKIELGDLLVIHDAGAHGHSMGFNYNGKLRSAEVLLRADGTTIEIRRAETFEDLFATLNLQGVGSFDA
ncbi:MAG: diaminopimelate decarboxylase [Pseudomonadota bacterium]|jgi:diaminopimelate decarboxylase